MRLFNCKVIYKTPMGAINSHNVLVSTTELFKSKAASMAREAFTYANSKVLAIHVTEYPQTTVLGVFAAEHE